ncbi:MAG: 2'-deoxycytidine 5'-triphosphate deaminase [Planctomycetota bacterium]
MENVRGALSAAFIETLIEKGCVPCDQAIQPSQIQPASLDLTLSAEAYKIPGSILPLRGERVRDLLDRFYARPVDLSEPQFLDRGQVYLIRLNEGLNLPPSIGAYTNNKSSTGRIDLQTRTISDGNPRYEKHRRGYKGPLWLEVISKSFDIRVRAGVSLNQAIFYGEREILGDAAMRELIAESPLLYDKASVPLSMSGHEIDQGILMSIDLDQDVVGYVARRAPEPLILDEPHRHDPSDFFEPILRPRSERLMLLKGQFYILSTLEYLRVPMSYAVEMLPYETTAGEFRAHYAGFFDPGFGFGTSGEEKGTPAVLEVRPYDDDLILRHGQPICKMVYERLCSPARTAYGSGGANHYAQQRGPRLSKYFSE